MSYSAHASSPRSARRDRRQALPAHYGSLAALLQAIREHNSGQRSLPIRYTTKYLVLPAPQAPELPHEVWGVLVTARIPCVVGGRGEAALSAWIVAEELPHRCATVSRCEAARARLAILESQVLAYLQANGFACRAGQYPVPVTAFRCHAHFCPRVAVLLPGGRADTPDRSASAATAAHGEGACDFGAPNVGP